MTQHTPGPWRQGRERGVHNFVYADDGNPDPVAIARYREGSESSAEANANARLIAAAPELLEALQAVVAMGYHDLPEVWQQVDDAIAKATGEQS